ncbi:MAG: pyrroline-5-carboxylate reductase [Cyanobacteria bacterium]|nr:pyrroline-5-carboxylate reductase [Cyanobacteriota bacterium]
MVRFGVIGGGVMAEAIVSRLLAAGTIAPTAVLVSEPMAQRRQILEERYAIATTDDNRAVITQAETILLAIKPQVFGPVAAALEDAIAGRTGAAPLILSILAGVPLAKLEAAFPTWPVVRAMPNTPATVGAAMTAIAAGQATTAAQLEQATALFQAIGEVVTVPETLMDAVTGLSGSGPAYVALLIEALADGGVAAGLPRAIALQLATQTVRGTAQLVAETGLHPAVLKDQVTSPGGTTIAGVTALENHGFRAAAIAAVKAAATRSRELGS